MTCGSDSDPGFGTQIYRKKRLLALFAALAMIGLIVGLIVAFKPEGKAPAVSARAILIECQQFRRPGANIPTTA